jgi:hypothetical protein
MRPKELKWFCGLPSLQLSLFPYSLVRAVLTA